MERICRLRARFMRILGKGPSKHEPTKFVLIRGAAKATFKQLGGGEKFLSDERATFYRT